MSSGINVYPLAHGTLADLQQSTFPTRVSAWVSQPLILEEGYTHFGYVHEGTPHLRCASGTFPLVRGLYFSVPGEAEITGGGKGFVASRIGYRGMFSLGGPVEEKGRLKYIDGCSDALLIPPVLMGDPCLNFLYLPPGINQTAHTHPSVRIGLIISGEGHCKTPWGNFALQPDTLFILYEESLHSFHTTDLPLRLVVYHPDSDFGPTHENHPMVNRTYVEGKSAALIDEIRTR